MKAEIGVLTEKQFRKYLKNAFRKDYIPPYLDPRYTQSSYTYPKEE